MELESENVTSESRNSPEKESRRCMTTLLPTETSMSKTTNTSVSAHGTATHYNVGGYSRTTSPSQPATMHSYQKSRPELDDYTHPKPPPTPGRPAASVHPNLLPSAPASPPTPAPSPGPHSRAPNWTCAEEDEVAFLRESTRYFDRLTSVQRERYLAELLNMCNSQQLVFVHEFVAPKLKKDPFLYLPNELCLRVSRFIAS